MIVTETKLKGCFVIEPTVFKDSRGYFFESFSQPKFEKATGQSGHFVQDNQSASTYGVIRGLHFQKGEHAQAKLVRVIEGRVLDVAVDLREESNTYGQWTAVELSSENNLQLYVPRGFAHGFSVLSETAVFVYKCDNNYNKESEGGIRYNDPTLGIEWGIPDDKKKISDKDLILPLFNA
ncbi:dTDP-4-dehydrorhamnose 3,5-epimerase [Arcticibacter tournemirensis]|uniref:dTDP-4-dehydrorhamnose 3,5-epimerase n=1 Tax=Arcticibacter tournemirensis TaxID=699437 RepID=A0A4Q0M8T9_9SPHI|nr:dTDP-4-dehydrorhamnose 3,5-epimerase [Arcticibacter tournemirensis]RXF69353.1 dTDP-4-dehydrorhamnose 3,5-epimerase [Arcticibacter tournemirensis]